MRSPSRPSERGRHQTAGEAYLRAAVELPLLEVRLGARPRAQSPQHRSRRCDALYAAHELLDPTAERIEAPLGAGTVVANLRRPDDQRSRAARGPDPGPRLDQGGVLPLGVGVPAPRDGHPVARRPRPGRDRISRLPSAPTTRSRSTAILDAVDGSRRSSIYDRVGAVGVSLGGHYVVRCAAFEPRLEAIAGVSGPYRPGGGLGCDALADPRGDRPSHWRRRRGRGARRAPHELNLDGVAERVHQPCLVVTGQARPRDRLGADQADRRRGAAARSGCCYEDGSHVCNNIPFKYRPLVADWMRDQLR